MECEQEGKGNSAYDERFMDRLMRDPSDQFGYGFSRQTVSAQSGGIDLSRKFPLPWSYYVRLLPVDKPYMIAWDEAGS